MLIKTLILSLFVVSCGKEVNLSNSKLEQSSQINQSQTTNTKSSGVLIRKSSSSQPDRLQYSGQTYNVSMYSSYNSLEFIASKAMGSTTAVQFKGKIVSQEILLEEIQ